MTGIDAIKAASWELHIKAERSGIIADILAGIATRHGVARFLRNLLPVYQVLDASRFCRPAIARSAAIQADLSLLSPGITLPLLPEAADYADRVRRAASDGGPGLIAHAYVRYLGDLNGGRIMQQRLAVCIGDLVSRLSFHRYQDLPDQAAFIRDYRASLDEAARAADTDAVLRETLVAFESNIALSIAVKAVVT